MRREVPAKKAASRGGIGSGPGRRALALGLLGLALVLGLLRLGQAPSVEREDLVAMESPSLRGLSELDREQVARQESLVSQIDISDALRLGQAYGRLGQLYLAYEILDAARPAFANAALLQPEDMRWPYLAGVAIKRQGEDAAAIERFQRAVDLAPDFLPAWAHLAESLRNLERLAEAEDALNRILAIQPAQAMAHYLLGLIAADRDDPAAAAARLEAALAAQPHASSLQYPLALAYRDLGQSARSEAALARRGEGRIRIDDPLMSEVVALRRDAGSLVSSAGLMVQQGRLEDAERAFRQAVALEPELVSARLGLGTVLGDQGRDAEAMAALEQVLAMDAHNDRARYSIAALHGRAGDLDAAIAVLDEVLVRAADEPKANEMRGIYLRRAGRCGEAVANLEAALAVDAMNSAVRLNLTVCQASLGRFGPALQAAETGLAQNADDPAATAAMVRLLACAPEPALRDGARAAALAAGLLDTGRSVDALEVMAMAQAELGRFEEAVALQRESIEAAEGQVDRAAVLDWMREGLADYERGVACREPWPSVLTEARDTAQTAP